MTESCKTSGSVQSQLRLCRLQNPNLLRAALLLTGCCHSHSQNRGAGASWHQAFQPTTHTKSSCFKGIQGQPCCIKLDRCHGGCTFPWPRSRCCLEAKKHLQREGISKKISKSRCSDRPQCPHLCYNTYTSRLTFPRAWVGLGNQIPSRRYAPGRGRD